MKSILLACAALLPAACIAAAPPIEAFFGDPVISQVSLSPSGNHVAFLHITAQGKQVVGVRDTRDPGKYSVPATAGSDHALITSIHWISDNRLGFTVLDRRLEFEGNMDEHAIDRDGRNATHLISGSWAQRGDLASSNMKTRLLTADYAYFAAVFDGSDDVIVQRHLWNTIDYAPESSRLYRLNTRTRELKDLLAGAQPGNVHEWLLDLDRIPRVAIASSKGRCTVWYRAKQAVAWSELSSQECVSPSNLAPAFIDASDTLHVVSGKGGYDALYTYDLANRRRAAAPLVSIEGFDFDGVIELDVGTKQVAGMHFVSDAGATACRFPST
jgi:hypothetical protein